MDHVNQKSISFREIAPMFEKGKICIVERTFTNVDFLIKDICDVYEEIEIISFYDTAEHYKSLEIANKIHLLPLKDSSVARNKKYLIDNVYDSYTIPGCRSYISQLEDAIFIYRSGTAAISDYYKYDTIVYVSDLECGISEYLDGSILIKNRYEVFYNLFFKLSGRETVYYLVQ